jgi:voltage-gated potassium channel
MAGREASQEEQMTTEPTLRRHGNSYEIFILGLTVLSLVIMVLLIMPLSQATLDTLRFYDNMIAFVFLADFAYNLTGSRPKSAYFIHSRGWLDLLGSIPSVGLFQLGGLLRLARLSRLARIMRLFSGQRRHEMVDDVLHNRSQYAVFITLFLALLVLVTSSVLVLQFESASPDANIRTGGDALWWSVVTITTVGYGDFFPVTTLGRLTAVFVMFAGVGIIGALASILASVLVAPAEPEPEAPPDDAPAAAAATVAVATPRTADASSLDALADEVRALRAEIAALRDGLRSEGR